MSKRMRLPNGFGQISKVKGNLRRPYRAMVTVGKNEEGRPICRLLSPQAYFETYNEAYEALLLFHKEPYEYRKEYTMRLLFTKWMQEYAESGKVDGTIQMTYRAWQFCYPIYEMHVGDVRQRHIRECLYDTEVDGIKPKPNMQIYIKIVLDMLLDYAVEYELASTNYSRLVKISKVRKQAEENRKGHIVFSDEELSIMWEHCDDENIKMMLIQCYSGWRPRELLGLRVENIDLDTGIMIGGSKTNSGKNRIVPIHDSIRDFIVEKYDSRNEWLFSHRNGKPISYDKFRTDYIDSAKKYGLSPEHRPHDGRKTFVTLAKKYGMDEYAIKRIVGHTITDLTENIYTE